MEKNPQRIAERRAVLNNHYGICPRPKTFYISSACYSENTKQMLDELRERISMSPNKAIKESFWQLDDDPLGVVDWVREHQKAADRHVMKQLLYSVPKITITPDGCRYEWSIDVARDNDFFSYLPSDVVRYSTNDVIATIEALNYYNKLNTEKEKEKMNAKRCDRCGKLYMEDHEQIHAYLCGRVDDHEKETYTPEKIKEFNTYHINVVINSSNTMDMCPECREKLKNFFESGADEAKEN